MPQCLSYEAFAKFLAIVYDGVVVEKLNAMMVVIHAQAGDALWIAGEKAVCYGVGLAH